MAQGFYLPFALLAFSVMVGGNWVADVLGILGGHMYYFLKVIHPAAGGAALAETPLWMCASKPLELDFSHGQIRTVAV